MERTRGDDVRCADQPEDQGEGEESESDLRDYGQALVHEPVGAVLAAALALVSTSDECGSLHSRVRGDRRMPLR
ncbi:hypothetical protein SAMN05216266_103281 [Amycolatopsis marina]|uniref:Uncharacterized protein n=1 Tax=Amycolatopsis marina TaxID=490629 RepID=A0A1I0XLR1_9PSEU|nr:hypothetical protein SAMN05216266_103281 [Amycolatopsis marina]